MSNKPAAAGKSSIDLIDTEKTFAIIDAKTGSDFLDMACGTGKYSIKIAASIGDNGTVYAVDLWQEGIEALKQEILSSGIKNIKAILADISKKLPLEDSSVNSCLMATILHDLAEGDRKLAIQEASRLLRPEGTLNIIEFKKIDKGPGPPIEIRLDENQIEELVKPCGFTKVTVSEIGPYNYLSKYRKN